MDSPMKVPFFDGIEVSFEDFEEAEPAKAQAALDAFLALGKQDRLAASRHVYAYYRNFHEMVGGEDWLDASMGVPARPEDIWAHVQPQLLFVGARDDMPGHVYVVIEASCDWEEEHGLMMVWEDGKTLVKVGGYDGHFTNEWAYDDEALRDVVYAGGPKWTTRIAE